MVQGTKRSRKSHRAPEPEGTAIPAVSRRRADLKALFFDGQPGTGQPESDHRSNPPRAEGIFINNLYSPAFQNTQTQNQRQANHQTRANEVSSPVMLKTGRPRAVNQDRGQAGTGM